MKPFAVAVALVVATGQTACLFRARPDWFRYYTLASSTEPPVKSAGGLTVGLGPVTLPGYVSRPSLVTRIGDNQVRYAEGERWAEPLGKQFTRTLSEDLSRALGAHGSSTMPGIRAHRSTSPWRLTCSPSRSTPPAPRR
jgi:uncharacterized lipoprotein YmbA